MRVLKRSFSASPVFPAQAEKHACSQEDVQESPATAAKSFKARERRSDSRVLSLLELAWRFPWSESHSACSWSRFKRSCRNSSCSCCRARWAASLSVLYEASSLSKAAVLLVSAASACSAVATRPSSFRASASSAAVREEPLEAAPRWSPACHLQRATFLVGLRALQ